MANSKNPHGSKTRMASVAKKSVPDKTSKATKAQSVHTQSSRQAAAADAKGKTLPQTNPDVRFSVSATDRLRFDSLLDHYEMDLRQVESKSEDVIRGIERLAELLPRLHLPPVTQTEQQIARANSLNLRFSKLLKKLHDELGNIASNFDE